MKSPQSTTSLPRAPRDDAAARLAKYLWTMSIRVVCFVLMILVHPYGWWTWVFALGAVFLPYIAVVIANVGQDSRSVPAVPPERGVTERKDTDTPASPSTAEPGVIRIQESPPPQDEK